LGKTLGKGALKASKSFVKGAVNVNKKLNSISEKSSSTTKF